MRTKFPRLLALSVLVFLLSSCGNPMSLWVIPGSTADKLVFGFSEYKKKKTKVKTDSIKVFPCSTIRRKLPTQSYIPSDESAVWVAIVPNGKRAHEGALPSNRLTYGKDEFGLRTEVGPKPLVAGECYVATARAFDDSSGDVVAFRIGANGSVEEITDEKEWMEIFKDN